MRSTGHILHAWHGEGAWNVIELFPDLNAMAACLGQLGAIVLDAGDELMDDEDVIAPRYRRQALTKLKSFLGSNTAAESVLARLGWD